MLNYRDLSVKIKIAKWSQFRALHYGTPCSPATRCAKPLSVRNLLNLFIFFPEDLLVWKLGFQALISSSILGKLLQQ